MGGKKTNITVVTERDTDKIRVFSLPNLAPIDDGGIPVFEGETEKSPTVLLYIHGPILRVIKSMQL
ncbi:MAG: hypothetical protein ACTIKE_14220 [Sphingobacterium sp.]